MSNSLFRSLHSENSKHEIKLMREKAIPINADSSLGFKFTYHLGSNGTKISHIIFIHIICDIYLPIFHCWSSYKHSHDFKAYSSYLMVLLKINTACILALNPNPTWNRIAALKSLIMKFTQPIQSIKAFFKLQN